ncbi:MAG: VirB3 family type IV secretion system protein [Pseudomonadota bacterium]
METGRLKVDPLFVGLTRPTLLFGVSQMFTILNAFACIGYFVMSNDLKAMIVLAFNHMIGFLATSKEPLFVELFMIKMQKCNKCMNKFYHGSNSYDMS